MVIPILHISEAGRFYKFGKRAIAMKPDLFGHFSIGHTKSINPRRSLWILGYPYQDRFSRSLMHYTAAMAGLSGLYHGGKARKTRRKVSPTRRKHKIPMKVGKVQESGASAIKKYVTRVHGGRGTRIIKNWMWRSKHPHDMLGFIIPYAGYAASGYGVGYGLGALSRKNKKKKKSV